MMFEPNSLSVLDAYLTEWSSQVMSEITSATTPLRVSATSATTMTLMSFWVSYSARNHQSTLESGKSFLLSRKKKNQTLKLEDNLYLQLFSLMKAEL